jgi:anhydro-N-acetylmuramic acid kinase
MQDSSNSYRVIGLMSGSALDGLDIACCDFTWRDSKWHFAILATACAPYNANWVERLKNAHTVDGKTLWHLHTDFGCFSGQAVRDFITTNDLSGVEFIGSHGHTVFHFPANRFTTQIGDGAALAYEAGLPVVCDFRSADLAKSGQGAPLVPIGDKLLLGQYKFLLNLGGMANLTTHLPNETVAFDICIANQVLNYYAQQKGAPYDDKGQMAAHGKLDQDLFDRLNQFFYYSQTYPKSLDNGYTREIVVPAIEQSSASIDDKLHTYCEHIAYQIGRHAKQFSPTTNDTILATGGGALNDYLVSRIAHHTGMQIICPDDNLIQFKEAIVFALMGVLRWRQDTNILASVTGAKADSIGGAIYLP